MLATPVRAGVHAYRASDGSEDASFVRLGGGTAPSAIVPDGARGVYLIGRIVVDGGERQVVHVRADGTIDPRFNVAIRGGRAIAGAVHGRMLALIGSFSSVGGEHRRGLAVVDTRSGTPLRWAPLAPAAAQALVSQRSGAAVLHGVAFAGTTLAVSTRAGLLGWRIGAALPIWTHALVEGGMLSPLVTWKGGFWTVGSITPRGRQGIYEIAAASGRIRSVSGQYDRVDSLQTVGGHLLTIVQGAVLVLFEPGLKRMGSCGRVPGSAAIVTAIAGNARTLYAGASPISLDAPGTVPGVFACPFSGGGSSFDPPTIAYGVHGPVVRKIALVGSHVLVFTGPF